MATMEKQRYSNASITERPSQTDAKVTLKHLPSRLTAHPGGV